MSEGKLKKGFALLSKEERRRIASLGGKASHGSRWRKGLETK
jgi:hypothetical protein